MSEESATWISDAVLWCDEAVFPDESSEPFPSGLVETVLINPALTLRRAAGIGLSEDSVDLLLVGPAIVRAVASIQADRMPQTGDASGPAQGELRSITAALLREVAVITLRALSVVGLPWALGQLVRWSFSSQAVVIGGARSGPRAMALSAAAVSRRWWQTFGVTAAFALIAVAPGPLIGISLGIFAGQLSGPGNALDGFLYALTIPFVMIGLALFYLRQNSPRRGDFKQIAQNG